MEEKKENNVLVAIANAITPNNIQKYVLGTKKNGQPRAIYDIVKDVTHLKKKVKHKKGKKGNSSYELYLGLGNTKKKKKKKNKYWHI